MEVEKADDASSLFGGEGEAATPSAEERNARTVLTHGNSG